MKSILLSYVLLLATMAYADQKPIPLPPDLFYPGFIKVLDASGASHALGLNVCKVALDPKNNVANNSMERCTDQRLNEEIHLPGGIYFLRLNPAKQEDDRIQNRSSMFVTIKDGEQLTIPLVAKSIAKSAGEFTVYLHRDLTNPAELESFLQREWYTGTSYKELRYFYGDKGYWCLRKVQSKEEARACQALKSKDYKGLIGAYKFNKQGGYNLVNIPQVRYEDSSKEVYGFDQAVNEVAYLKDGDTIAVFPGVFGAFFRNSVGYWSTVTGIDFRDPSSINF